MGRSLVRWASLAATARNALRRRSIPSSKDAQSRRRSSVSDFAAYTDGPRSQRTVNQGGPEMRRALCVLALVVAVTACRSSAPSEATFTSADEAAVRKTLDDYTPLTLAKNWDGIVALYTSDAVRFA